MLRVLRHVNVVKLMEGSAISSYLRLDCRCVCVCVCSGDTPALNSFK